MDNTVWTDCVNTAYTDVWVYVIFFAKTLINLLLTKFFGRHNEINNETLSLECHYHEYILTFMPLLHSPHYITF